MKKLFLPLLLLASFSVKAQVASPAAGDAVAGKAKYDTLCVTCHGPTGLGDGAAAAALTPKPRNFRDTAYMAKKTDADLAKVIKEGGAAAGLSASMPPWGSMLTDADIANVVAYIRQLGK